MARESLAAFVVVAEKAHRARPNYKRHLARPVVDALRRATIRSNGIGMDDLYDEISKADSTDGLCYAFDITWLAAFADELKRSSKSA